jgi:hypothetical protein
MPITEPTSLKTVGCCPSLEPCDACDQLDITYRLPFRPVVAIEGTAAQVIPVEVTLRFQLERCSGPLTLGDLLYSTTLLPGENVQLFTSDRHSRFSFDSSTQLASRQYTTSEDSFYLAGMANATSDLTVLAGGSQTSTFHDSAVSGGGSAGLDLGFFSIGGSAAASSYDANSASTFASFLSQHAQTSSRHVEAGVHAAASTSIGEVSTRTHTASESEDQYESSSRTFSNPNRCRALTFLFYRIDKCNTVKFSLVGIDRRVDDPASPTGVELNPAPPARNVAIIPDAILGTHPTRLEVAQQVNQSIPAEQTVSALSASAAAVRLGALPGIAQDPIPVAVRIAALAQVDADLQAEGLLDKNGQVTADAQQHLGWQRELRLPTPGVLVKGCLDDCSTCEPEREKEIQLDLTRKELENQLLKRKIELLDKAQEYRCCPDQDESAKPAAATA